MVIVSAFVFFALHLLSGDVATLILQGPDGGGTPNPKDVAQLDEELGLNKPLVVQYLDWAKGIVKFDPGKSLWTRGSIIGELRSRLPLTLELTLLATAITALVGMSTGVISALRPGGWIDGCLRVVTALGLAVPNFWLGTLLILLFVVTANWSPPLGYSELWQHPLRNIEQIGLPVVALSLHYACLVSRMTRSALIEIMREDYIRTARAKGLGSTLVVTRHALRNALLPVLTLVALQFGYLLGGTVIIETLFNLPGIGRYLVDSIGHRDYPVVQTIVFFFTASFIIINIVTDLFYGAIDPRISSGHINT